MMGRKQLGVMLTAIAVAVGSGAFVLPAHATVVAVGGGAFGVRVNIDLPANSNVFVPDSPAIVLPPEGNRYGLTTFNQAAGATIAGFTIGAMRVETNGNTYGFPYAESSAFVGKIRIDDSIIAESVGSHCIWDVNGARGETTMNGDPRQTPAANTEVALPGLGHAIFNEQYHELVGDAETIYVIGLHLYLNGRLGRGEVILAESSCDPNQIPLVGGSIGSPPT